MIKNIQPEDCIYYKEEGFMPYCTNTVRAIRLSDCLAFSYGACWCFSPTFIKIVKDTIAKDETINL